MAHFTRIGNSQTPESTASLPSSSGLDPAVGAFGQHGVDTPEERLGLLLGLALERRRHQRGRGLGDGAAGALEGDVRDEAVRELHVERELVAAQGVEALGRVGWRPSSSPKFRGCLLWSRITSW